MEFQIFQDSARQYRWRFVATNGRTLADGSEGYVDKAGAQHGIGVLKAGGGAYTLYQDNARQWRWRFVANNSRTIADSGEGYVNRADAEHGMGLVKANAATAPVRDQTSR